MFCPLLHSLAFPFKSTSLCFEPRARKFSPVSSLTGFRQKRFSFLLSLSLPLHHSLHIAMNPPEQRVSLLALSQEALKNPSLTLETINHLSTHGALPDTIVHTLDGWLAGSAIVLEKDLLQRSDDRLRALLHFILNRKISVTDFVSCSCCATSVPSDSQ